jgi:transcriptional regulator with XRE-family HTH domain
MGQKSIKGSLELAKFIKLRRTELDLTIEEAASKAGVGTKTWSRYESGESIRKDKCRGICNALKWRTLPIKEEDDTGNTLDINEYKNHEAWSPYLVDNFGKFVATSFVIGSDILLDNLRAVLEALSSMPRGSHVGETDTSWIESLLPSQFLMRYDYDFLYILRNTVNRFRLMASMGSQIIAHSVIEELSLYLIMEESRFLMESMDSDMESDDKDSYGHWDSWAFDIFDDMDLITYLYSDIYLADDDEYHFNHWLERQFFCE